MTYGIFFNLKVIVLSSMIRTIAENLKMKRKKTKFKLLVIGIILALASLCLANYIVKSAGKLVSSWVTK